MASCSFFYWVATLSLYLFDLFGSRTLMGYCAFNLFLFLFLFTVHAHDFIQLAWQATSLSITHQLLLYFRFLNLSSHGHRGLHFSEEKQVVFTRSKHFFFFQIRSIMQLVCYVSTGSSPAAAHRSPRINPDKTIFSVLFTKYKVAKNVNGFSRPESSKFLKHVLESK